jgi:hypothetical protein
MPARESPTWRVMIQPFALSTLTPARHWTDVEKLLTDPSDASHTSRPALGLHKFTYYHVRLFLMA